MFRLVAEDSHRRSRAALGFGCTRAYVWAGAGLGVLYTNPEVGDSNTDVGLNLLFGVGLKGHVVPYVQGKVIVSEDTAFVLGVGLRF